MSYPLRVPYRDLLGLNRRNHELVARYNPRHLFQVVDHKLKTKAVLRARGLPVVETLRVYRAPHEVSGLAVEARAWSQFVLKPAQGAGGEGVMVVTGHQDAAFVTLDGGVRTARDLESHAADILGGVFSLNQRYDEALIERRVQTHPTLAQLSYAGLPDVRIIVFQGIPLMAMLRATTRASRGRANLHAGGIGIGIALTSGVTTYAIAGTRAVTCHPDTQARLTEVSLPHWQELLTLASCCADAVPLGYLGVDLTVDAEAGPLVLELNARPGLSIQLANRRGLRPLIETVEHLSPAHLPVRERVPLIQKLAGNCL